MIQNIQHWEYFPDYDGGFIGSDTEQICDFRKGMGEKYGKIMAEAVNSQLMSKDQILSAAKQVFFDMFHQSGEWFFDYFGTEEENARSTQTSWEEFEERLAEKLDEKLAETLGGGNSEEKGEDLSFWLDSGSERCYTGS